MPSLDLALCLRMVRSASDTPHFLITQARKGYKDTNPALVREAKRLARKNPKSGMQRFLRQIANELANAGNCREFDKPYWSSPKEVVHGYSYEHGGSAMANKRPKPEEIVAKLRQVEVLVGQGKRRIDAIREIGIVEQTFYRWRKQYGGMGTDQVKELKRLQMENERLRRAVSDLTLEKLILSEAARGNF